MNLVDLDLHAVDAVDARQEVDLRAGAAFTRLQTMRLGPLLKLDSMLLSYGPCQFPTLGFVVDHYKRVETFVPEEFWSIDLRHAVSQQGQDRRTNVEFLWDRNHLFDKRIVHILHKRCKDAEEAEVKQVVRRTTWKRKPTPLTTVELQKNLSRLSGMAPKRILDVAESLYQRGLLSYPRTETNQYDKDFDFVSLLDKQRSDCIWGAHATEIFASATGNGSDSLHSLQYERPRDGQKNDKAHPPIHPTAHANDLKADEKQVYDYVTRRFLASCTTDAMGEETKIFIEMGGESFHTSGLLVKTLGFLTIFPYEKWTSKFVPEYQERQRFRPSSISVKSGSTSPPNLLTEADLVHLMDKHGIGTDATIAEHIKKVIDRQYVVITKQGKTKYLVPSTLGMGLVEGYERLETSLQLCKPKLRHDTETQLGLIATAQRTKQETVSENLTEYKRIYDIVERDFEQIRDAVCTYFRTLPQDEVQGPRWQHARREQRQAEAYCASPFPNESAQTESSTPTCHCSAACTTCTEHRSGREYWACGNRDLRGHDCGFFRWCAMTPTSPHTNEGQASRILQEATKRSADREPRAKRAKTNGQHTMCNCDLIAKCCRAQKVCLLTKCLITTGPECGAFILHLSEGEQTREVRFNGPASERKQLLTEKMSFLSLG